MKKIIANKEGFIAVMALGIFALLAIFGIMIQSTTMRTISEIKNSNNFYAAQDIAFSVGEYLQYELGKHGSGYNLNEVHCTFTDGVKKNDDPVDCDEFMPITVDGTVKVTYEIKGRANPSEKFQGGCPGIGAAGNGDCYVVPFPGTGDAGAKCNLYTPTFGSGSAVKLVNHNGQFITQDGVKQDGVKQVDYSCNWGKLFFGSSSTDRVSIPFHYDTGNNDQGNAEIVNTFHKDTVNRGDYFVLRMRAPCKPCEEKPEQGAQPEGTRACTAGADKTICADEERFELNLLDGDDIVVQWQLSGQCPDGAGERECELVMYEGGKDGSGNEKYSALTESRINTKSDKILTGNLKGTDISIHPADYPYILGDDFDEGLLRSMKNPALALFLNEKLISKEGKLVPYLEYQVLTDSPIGDAKIKMNAEAYVNGNSFEETLYRSEKKPLIDFAIQQ